MVTASRTQQPMPAGHRAEEPRPPTPADWVWAAAAAAAALPVTLVEIFGAARVPHDAAWLAVTLTLLAVLHVGVVFRRRAPRVALAAASAVMLVLTIMSLPGAPTIVVLLPSSLAYLMFVFTAAMSDDRVADVAALVVGVIGAGLITSVAVAWEPAAEVGLLIALGGFLVASIGAAWALGRYLRESRRKLAAQALGRQQAAELQLQAERVAVADERRRIGRELHDVISHSLAVMVAQAEAARVLHGRDDARSRTAVEQVVATGRAAMADMRGLLGVLAEPPGDTNENETPPLAPSPGLDDVAGLVELASGPERLISLTQSGPPCATSPGVALTAYRVVQESLTNTLKHTDPPTRSDVQLAWVDHELIVTVTDDGGAGATAGPHRPGQVGRGIRGMGDRVEQAGGRFESGPRADRGWQTRASLPLNLEEHRG
ncbi:sensor histidine kinase [Agromyces albus]|uniref:sensor histidine kinase n=1 Tax=Agromyces albus TaxID=205332 RepID=UPI002788BE22|nr:histidine kinase [Agromyces albus]MDQ0576222.1 signal transduction histidine kinase [Agromyces albus]